MRDIMRRRRKAAVFLTAALTSLGTLAVPGAAGADPTADGDARVLAHERLADGTEETTIRLGPITMAPHEGDHGGGHDGEGHGVGPMHGPHEPMHGTHTRSLQLMLPPCVNCYVTGIQPDLVYEDGSKANYDTGAMLHHAVFFDRSKSDVTCDSGWPTLAGRRIFASGNERTGRDLPAGNGVRLGFLPLTYVALELMNMKPEKQKVYFEVTMKHVPAGTPGMRELTPVWLDADNCGLSEHSIPKGESHTRWAWSSSVSGTFRAAGGHLHDGGESITLKNLATKETICTSEAGYGTIPAYQGHIESMSTCAGEDLGSVRKGDTLELHSVYHSHYADDHAMSIMIGYLDQR
ncbi:hypothetical protein SAMN05216266_111179 [Amycolatopsis marina]|uniref:Copper type II ascorbate-dependent monooxygenase, C-terminal domain n=1 Tax=Amycolatopsis marina TaxID=490629 RepID=A0A1I1B1M7_9PSEU|nr:hypothetical protein [Amycolatopsis marina]SFB44235.1 hypothetical protein SAMN05216266_111179 [Amycolatopsis marina]